MPPWTPRIQSERCELRRSVGELSGRRSIPACLTDEVVRRMCRGRRSRIVTAMDYDTPNMRVDQWNLSLQKQIGSDWLVSASYLGNATSICGRQPALNPAIFLGLGPCTLNGVQYTTCSTTANTRSAPPPDSGESGHRPMLWLRQSDRHAAARPATTACSSPFSAARRAASRSAEITPGRIASAIPGRRPRTARTRTQGWTDSEQPPLRPRQLQRHPQRTAGMFSISRASLKRRSFQTQRCGCRIGLAVFADLQNHLRRLHVDHDESGSSI